MRSNASLWFTIVLSISLSFVEFYAWGFPETISFEEPRPLRSLAGIDLGAPIKAGACEKLHIAVSENDMTVLRTPGGWSTVLIDGCVLSSPNPGAPQLPKKSIRVALPKGATVLSVSVVSGKASTLVAPLQLSPAPEPAFWPGQTTQVLREDDAIYRAKSPFPKRLIDYYVGSNGKQTIVTVRFSPLIFYPVERRVVVVTDAVLRIDYALDPGVASGAPSSAGATCVIITPKSMSAAAEEMKSLHEADGIETEVVTLETIFFTYDEAEDAPYDGYPYGSPIIPIRYDYSLAKKIVSFLRDEEEHPSLEYVTILGDGSKVPASYYYHDADSGLGLEQDWVPTDFFYSSPDYDLVPNYKVGRLPVRDLAEATRVALKMRAWRQAAQDRSWFDNVMVAGSRPFHTPYYYGELMSLDMLNSGYFDGMTVAKAFGTDGRYTVDVVSEGLRDGGYGFIYDSGHGFGPGISLDDGMITSDDLFSYAASNFQLPIVVSIACICGQFDSPSYSRSFGEGVVLSPAGGIAYYGGSRINAGIASQAFDNGNLIVTKQEHMGGMTKDVFASFSAGASDLGSLYTGAINRFLSENDWDDFLVRRTLFEFVLLGDPALQIPRFQGGEANEVPVFVPTNPDFINNESLPSYTNSQLKTVRASVEADSEVLNFKLVNATDVEVVEKSTQFGPLFDYSFSPAAGFKLYVVRAEARDGKEGWFLVNTASSLLCIDGDLTDWDNELIRPIAVDPTLDFNDPEYDVSSLRAYADPDYWHLAFTATCQNKDMSYVLAIDYGDGGFSGRSGPDTDAAGNYVTFDPEFAVDAEIYLNHVTWVPWLGWESFRNRKFYRYSGPNDWSAHSLQSIGAILSYSAIGNLVELAVPTKYLGGYPDINVILFSVPSDAPAPAQDSVPSDPATFDSLTLGREHANTLSQFAHVSCKPVNCILGAGFMGSHISASHGGTLQVAAVVNPEVGPPQSMEIYLDNVPTGLFLNDNGTEGDYVAGDGFWTFHADCPPGLLPAGQYRVSIVATDELGGCIGQWPQVLLSFCDELAAPDARLTSSATRRFQGISLPAITVAPTASAAGCPILLAGVANTATNIFAFTIEAFAYVQDSSVDAIEVCYAGTPLGVELLDDGAGCDIAANDGIFSGSFRVDRDIPVNRQYTLELMPLIDGEPGPAWPYLTVND